MGIMRLGGEHAEALAAACVLDSQVKLRARIRGQGRGECWVWRRGQGAMQGVGGARCVGGVASSNGQTPRIAHAPARA